MNDYNPAFGFDPIQVETVKAAGRASKKVAIALFTAAAAGTAYVISRPRVQRALKELMTPEPKNATVNVAAEDYKDARDNAGPSKS